MDLFAFIQVIAVLPQAQAIAATTVASMNVGLLVNNVADVITDRRAKRALNGSG